MKMEVKNLTKKTNEAYQDMYICMTDAHEKKKYVLQGIKDSLIMQEEYEKVAEIRKNKSLILKEIKSQMTTLDSLYQNLRKELPNVKGILSYTEKELEELEEQIGSLKGIVKRDEGDLKDAQNIRDTMEELDVGIKGAKSKVVAKKEVTQTPKPEIKKEVEKVKPIHKEPTKPLSKLERIKNNLKVIEGKIKEI